jgi:hypothetical protein
MTGRASVTACHSSRPRSSALVLARWPMSGLSQGDPGAWLSSDCIRMINQDVIDLYLRAA